MVGNASVLRTRGHLLDDEQRREALDDIESSAQRLTVIIDNLLTLARLEREGVLESEPLPLLRMAQACSLVDGRRVVVDGDAGLLALGGESYVEQVLQNLIANAVKYSPTESAVEVSVRREGELAVVRVSDRGEGIADAEREAIFQPFYRSDRTSALAEGVGIGLSVCRRLIEAMDGAIWCEAREGGGSEFGFSLPLVPEHDLAAEHETAAPRAQLASDEAVASAVP